jgi:hypothetical protein
MCSEARASAAKQEHHPTRGTKNSSCAACKTGSNEHNSSEVGMTRQHQAIGATGDYGNALVLPAHGELAQEARLGLLLLEVLGCKHTMELRQGGERAIEEGRADTNKWHRQTKLRASAGASALSSGDQQKGT